jgi:hypothetical protein
MTTDFAWEEFFVRSCRAWLLVALLALAYLSFPLSARADDDSLQAGFAEADITPQVGDKPVYMAGFGNNRRAKGVHDPLKARALVLKHGGRKIALACVDLVGFFHANVENVRKELPGFTFVLVSSTHNHEGPDTLGLWGPLLTTSGVDPTYLKKVEEHIAQAIRQADQSAQPVIAHIGSARAPELLHDGRLPTVKHDELVAVEFLDPTGQKPRGLIVQWNCHPETLAEKNTQISADFVGHTVRYLRDRYGCPVLYLTGTVGGLMTSLDVDIKDDQGKPLANGTEEKTERYGCLVGKLAERALGSSKPFQVTPLEAHSRAVFMPLDNQGYVLMRQLGVLKREAFVWQGDWHKAQPAGAGDAGKRLCLSTEVGWLRLGELDVALVPGEIYPELVLGKVQDPPDPGADFPDAPIEPAIYQQLRGPYRMIVGLANDEIGYIIPKRQWDVKPPFCYGLKKAQYGETNSVGPETAPILCRAFQELVTAGR